ncbi:sensor histidine kinase [Micromonospora cathayae]|uniref:histidine kinase n=1 Tax=Micromonospora cathayae TaxID=3028804 RepID=A0ABY7ZKT5_9ACTN|nr:sensor histidine kinase [Micromonospora sp. HUAS 3]WDZ83586.1 sensor histidine kinase [Micromonospora sp. HUAS 3]
MPTSPTAGRIAARLVLAVTAVFTTAAVAAWCVALPAFTVTQLYSLVDLMDGIVYGGVAWLVLGRRRTGGRLAGWITAAAAVGGSVSAFAAQWGLLSTGPYWLLSAHHWAWIPGLYALVVVMPWLLPERRPRPVERIAVAVGLGYVALAWVAVLTAPAPRGLVPLGPAAVELRAGLVRPLPYLLVLLGLAAAVGAGWRWRRGPRDGRHGMGWATAGSALLTLAFLTTMLPPLLPATVPALLMLASQAFFPAAVAVVVLRQQMWGLRLVVRRTLVWYLMTAGVIAAYSAAVTVLDRLLPDSSSAPRIVVTAAIAAAFQPVRQAVQRAVDRLVHGDSPEPLMRRVADSLRSSAEIGPAVAAALRLAGVTVTDGPGPPPDAGGRSVTVPLTSGDRTVGYLHAWPRPGELLGSRATGALTELAPVVAAVVDLARTNEELTRSRRRLAEARDEERRALRRDLHDGLGPALSGIGLGLAATRNLLHRDPARADELLDRLIAELTTRADDVRDLAHGLLPPILADGGLEPAVDTLRHRFARDGLAVTVHVPVPLEPLPGSVATAAYGVAAEAVRNVHRHAGVRHCTVRLDRLPHLLRISVTDHGRGLPAAGPAPGVGLHAMRERADGVGGTLTVGPAEPRGTTVCLSIPLEAA